MCFGYTLIKFAPLPCELCDQLIILMYWNTQLGITVLGVGVSGLSGQPQTFMLACGWGSVYIGTYAIVKSCVSPYLHTTRVSCLCLLGEMLTITHAM